MKRANFADQLYDRNDAKKRERFIVALRLCEWPPGCIARFLDLPEEYVKEVLDKHGRIDFSITEETAKQLQLPSYIPRTAGKIENLPAMLSAQEVGMIVDGDMPAGIMWKHGIEPFHDYQRKED